MNTLLRNYRAKVTKAAPLAVFRILFGFLMFVSLVRFWWNGWIEKLYLEPSFHFHYYGFEWVQIPPGNWIYVLFIAAALSALAVMIGFYYRWAISMFFILFTYIELLDKTTYLNHYYFISILSFLLIFLPMHRYFSWDARRGDHIAAEYVPQWTVDSIKLLLAIVYIYAGLAKLNHDWLFNAMPLTLWLPVKFETPLIGFLMHERWMHYLFSWGGAIYDLTIVFFLLNKRTRVFAFAMVVIFHVLTRVLFPIGMFPFIMIFSTLIFFSPSFHQSILNRLSNLLSINIHRFNNKKTWRFGANKWHRLRAAVLILFFSIQILFPLRYLVYPGNIYWNELGYRFSWRVMLMEKTGYANFKIVNAQTGKRFYVENDDFLTAFQEKQMSTQVDFIIEYAHHLGEHFAAQGHEHIQVFVESYAALNGRMSQTYVKDDIDLLQVDQNSDYNELILPLNE